MILEHIRRVRALPGLSASKVVFAPETNLGGEAERLVADLRRAHAPNIYTLHEDKKKPGIRTTNLLKKQMWIDFKLALGDRRVRFHPYMAVGNPKHDAEGMRSMLISELRTYTRKLEYSKSNPYQLPAEIFTGKVAGGQDDHAIVVQLLHISRKMYEAKAEFYRQQGPIWTPGMVTTHEYYDTQRPRPLVSVFD